MSTFLVVVVILLYLGFVISTVMFAMDGQLKLNTEVSLFALITFNLCCSRHLYKKAEKNKVEWALFGSIGNLTALICFLSSRRRT